MTSSSLHSIEATVGASIHSIGTAVTLAAIGVYLHRRGFIVGEGKRTLALISQQVTFPLFLFTKIIYCNQDWSSDPCPDITKSLTDVWMLLFWPFVVVGLGILVGYVVAKVCRTPQHQVRAVLAAVAFGNSTGLCITMLTVVHANFPNTSDLGRIDPTLFLSVYLLLYPILQWGIGGWLLAPKIDEVEEANRNVINNVENNINNSKVQLDKVDNGSIEKYEKLPPEHIFHQLKNGNLTSSWRKHVLNNKEVRDIYLAHRRGLASNDEGLYMSELNLVELAQQIEAEQDLLDYLSPANQLADAEQNVQHSHNFLHTDNDDDDDYDKKNHNHFNDDHQFDHIYHGRPSVVHEDEMVGLMNDSQSSFESANEDMTNDMVNVETTDSRPPRRTSYGAIDAQTNVTTTTSNTILSHRNSHNLPTTLTASPGPTRKSLAMLERQRSDALLYEDTPLEIFKNILKRCFQPPVVGALAGIVVAMISPLRGVFVDIVDRQSHAPLQFLFDGLYSVGLTAVPINMMILGCNLSASQMSQAKVKSLDNSSTADSSLLPMPTMIGIVLGKMVVLPALGLALVVLLKKYVLNIPDDIDGAFYLVLMIVLLTPTANNVMVMVELSGSDAKEGIARVIALQYAAAPVILCVTMTIAIGFASNWS